MRSKVGEQPAAETADRILRAFLRLVAERGIDATTTRALAEAAGVNEVTIFRHFGDKASLAREAIRRWHPAHALTAYEVAIDSSSPASAAQGLLGCLRFLRRHMQDHDELIQFGMGEYWRFPELREELAAAPRAASGLLVRALTHAAPALLPTVDLEVTALGLLGLVFNSIVWQRRGWLDWSDAAWECALAAAIRPLLRAA